MTDRCETFPTGERKLPYKIIAQGYRLFAAERFHQHVFCENIVSGSGKSACTIGWMGCPRCGFWGAPTVHYPTVDCAGLTEIDHDFRRFVRPGGTYDWDRFTPDEFREFAERLKGLLGARRPLMPGTVFGTWPGWAIGEIGDFAWRREWQPVVRETAFQTMLGAGFEIAGAAIPVRSKRDIGERLIELEIPPTARLSPDSGFSQCKICGKFEPGKVTIIDETSYDRSIPLQRILEQPDIIVVSSELADFMHSHNFTDVAVEPIEFQ